MLYASCILIGLLTGFLSALLGIGGGVVFVPLLLVVLGIDIRIAIGTSLAYIVPVALSGALQHGLRGNINPLIVAIAVPAGLIGTYLGAKLGAETSKTLLKQIFGLVLLVTAFKMIVFPSGFEGLLLKVKAQGSGPSAVAEAPASDQPREP